MNPPRCSQRVDAWREEKAGLVLEASRSAPDHPAGAKIGRSHVSVPLASSMQIQINAPHGNAPDDFYKFIEERITEVLQPYESHLTRIEVHLKDQNADKGGVDQRCMMEARLRGRDPIATEAVATEPQDAVRQALDKLKHALRHRIGKLKARR